MTESSAGQPQNSQRFRRVLRYGRFFGLLALLSASGFLYLNRIGLPDSANRRIETELRARGMNLQFDRLRLCGLRTLVADHVRWLTPTNTNHPTAALNHAEIRLRAQALFRFQLQIEALTVRHGHLVIQFPGSDTQPPPLPVEEIHLDLRFLPNAQWDLLDFRARCLNAELSATGTITNALALRKRRTGAPAEKPASDWAGRLNEFAAKLARFEFSPQSSLRLDFRGDGREPSGFHGSLRFQTPKAATPWGTVKDTSLGLDLHPSDLDSKTARALCELRTGPGQAKTAEFEAARFFGTFTGPLTNFSLGQAQWELQLQNARAPWGEARQLALKGTTTKPAGETNEPGVHFTLDVSAMQTPWGSAKSSTMSARLFRPPVGRGSLEGSWELVISGIDSKWGVSESARLSGHLRRSPGDAPPDWTNTTRGLWRKLGPVSLDWEGKISRVTSPSLQVDGLEWAAQWRPPELVVRKLNAQLYGGSLDLNAALSVATRELRSQVAFDFDVHPLAPLLPANTQRWLRQFGWERPPRVATDARMILPAWTNREPNRFKEALRTLALTGSFDAGEGAFRGVAVTAAHSQFTLSNSVWRLPDLIVTRPEGQAHLDGREDMTTRSYDWGFRGQIDPKALEPLLSPAQKKGLDYFGFTQPPFVQGHMRGKWREPERVGVSALVAATNFTFRGEALDVFQGGIQFTNGLVRFQDAKVRRGQEQITAEWVGYDPRAGLVWVTNGVSSMEPDRVTRVISSQVRATLSPYRFKAPPTVVVNGQIPTVARAVSDASFRVTGQSFNYWRFNVPAITGDVHWRGDTLSISNLQASFYQGRLKWDGYFDWSGTNATRYQFRGQVAQANLQLLLADLTAMKSSLEGTLDASLVITSADTSSWNTWRGSGSAQFRDGFLWNIPMFGFFSPVLNKLMPGLAQSRVSSGSANFLIDKGVIRTADLEMRAPALRLQYVGTVDFKGNVDARVQAEILRDAWAVGRVLSLALWPLTKVFEYKVSGTLNEPSSELLYFPKFLMWPFRPFKTMKDIFSSEPSAPAPPPAKNPLAPNKPQPPQEF
ncbi:MAG: hypothetical protein HY735_32205 [Verrucomicrobia bacterium]|nr:hypothetical protein [Verrucomicrobiota bacterium]